MRITRSNFFTKEHMKCFLGALFLFVFVFFIFSNNDTKWKVSPDMYGYVQQEFKNPWRGARTPGLPLFWKALGVRDDLRKNVAPWPSNNSDVEKSSKNFPTVNKALTRIAYAQTFILAFSFSLLFLALNEFIPKSISLLICLFCICFCPLPPTNAILTDSLAVSLSIIFVALALFWFCKKGLFLLFLLCFVAVYAVLVRPDFGFLSLAALILCLTKIGRSLLHKEKTKVFSTIIITVFLCGGTLFWPLYLSAKGGVLISGQYEYLSKRAFAIHVLEDGDENLYNDQPSKSLVAELIKSKGDYDKSLNEKVFAKKGREQYSPPYVFNYVLHPYSDDFYEKTALKYFKWKSLPEMLKQTNLICNPIIRKHFSSYLLLVKSIFLSSIDYYPDFIFPFFENNLRRTISLSWLNNMLSRINSTFIFGYNLNFYFFTLSYCLIFLAFIFCKKNALRFPIIFIASLYPIHMLLISLNHGIFPRYPKMSQIALLLSTLLSLYILLLKFRSSVNTMLAGRPQNSYWDFHK